MSVNEIMLELEKMTSEELAMVEEKLAQLHGGEFEPTPEELTAIEEGRAAFQKEGGITVEAMRRKITSWNTK